MFFRKVSELFPVLFLSLSLVAWVVLTCCTTTATKKEAQRAPIAGWLGDHHRWRRQSRNSHGCAADCRYFRVFLSLLQHHSTSMMARTMPSASPSSSSPSSAAQLQKRAAYKAAYHTFKESLTEFYAANAPTKCTWFVQWVAMVFALCVLCVCALCMVCCALCVVSFVG